MNHCSPGKPRNDEHQEYNIHIRQIFFHFLDRRIRAECKTESGMTLFHKSDILHNTILTFAMNRHDIILIDVERTDNNTGMVHKQMDVKWERCYFSHIVHHVGSKRQIWNKSSIHNIYMKIVNANLLNFFNVPLQIQQIGTQDRKSTRLNSSHQ